MSGESTIKIVPMLSLHNASRASAFYQSAFGARELSRSASPEGRIVAMLAIGQAEFGVADEAPQVGNLSRRRLGGRPSGSASRWPTPMRWPSGRSTPARN
jgi:uncharacterized glyoxalase superfamily protein PhnB